MLACADGIELDVRLARDGMPVVIHDADLKRTALRKTSVASLTSAELGAIDAGSWFNRQHRQFARDEYANEHVPTLGQVFEIFARVRNKQWTIYVEVKTEPGSYQDLCEAVSGIISEYRFARKVVLVSFDLKALERMKTIDSTIRTGALFEPKRSALKIIGAR